jgi:hypothetical protein
VTSVRVESNLHRASPRSHLRTILPSTLSVQSRCKNSTSYISQTHLLVLDGKGFRSVFSINSQQHASMNQANDCRAYKENVYDWSYSSDVNMPAILHLQRFRSFLKNTHHFPISTQPSLFSTQTPERERKCRTFFALQHAVVDVGSRRSSTENIHRCGPAFLHVYAASTYEIDRRSGQC